MLACEAPRRAFNSECATPISAVRRASSRSWNRCPPASIRLCALLLIGFQSIFLGAQAQGASCHWLAWHPSTASKGNTSTATLITTPLQQCSHSSFVTDFYADMRQDNTSSPYVRSISARCSDGGYIGYYAVLGGNVSTSLPQVVAHSSSGFTSLNGSAADVLESVGRIVDAAHAWTDSCPSGTIISGFQVTFVRAEEVKQIKLLCSGPEDSCSALAISPAEAVLADSPTLPPAQPAGAPSPSQDSTYVIFALQYTFTADEPTVQGLEGALQALNVPLMASLFALSGDCPPTQDTMMANTSTQCFQAGPVAADQALMMIQAMSRAVNGGAFNQALADQGFPVTSSKILFATVSSQSAMDLQEPAGPRAPSPTPSSVGRKSSDASPDAGIIAGSVVAGCAVLAILAMLVAWLAMHRRKQRAAVLGSKKLGADSSGLKLPASPAKTLRAPAYKSPFQQAEQSGPMQGWQTSACFTPGTSAQAVQAERQKRSSKLVAGLSAPPPSVKTLELSEGPNKLWTAQPPGMGVPSMSPWFMEQQNTAAGRHWHRLTQDSDEVLDAEQGGVTWKVMHDEVIEAGPELDAATSNLYAQPEWQDIADGAGRPENGPSSAESQYSLPPSTRGLEEEAWEDWHIRPSDLQICRHSDGRYNELGTGAFGKVYKALLNEVTEVAVKRLEASTSAQRALFIREIEIHKRCRSAHVVQFLGACIQHDCMILVTELMKESLYQLVHEEKEPFSWDDQGRSIAQDVAQALAYLHKQRVVHLDIKSSNVLMTKDGRAKIADVGLSQVLQNTYLSQVDGLGTFAYAAPELLSGGSNCSTKADIWSYGVLLHEMVTRQHPKRGALTDIEPHHCPEHVKDLIYQCIKREPADRPSAKTIVKVLQAATPEQAGQMLTDCLAEDCSSGSLESRSRSNSRRARQLARWSSMPERQTPNLERWSFA